MTIGDDGARAAPSRTIELLPGQSATLDIVMPAGASNFVNVSYFKEPDYIGRKFQQAHLAEAGRNGLPGASFDIVATDKGGILLAHARKQRIR